MNYVTKFLLAVIFTIMTSGSAMASHICAYVNDNVKGLNAVEGYKVGPGNETLHIGPYRTNGRGLAQAFSSGGLAAARFKEGDLYVGDIGSNNITHFIINKTDCTLSKDPTKYPSGDTQIGLGDSLTITPGGHTMFVGSTGDDHIYSHTIAANGALGATFTEALGSDYPVEIVVSPDGETLLVTYLYALQVCAYPIVRGHLGAPNCQSTGNLPYGISVDPDSSCVYAGELNDGGPSEIASFKLTAGVLGPAMEYNAFGPATYTDAGVLVNWDNTAIYISDSSSAQITIGTITPGCNLRYKTIISDGRDLVDHPGQIAQAPISHGYVVTGDINYDNTPSMGVFEAHENGNLTPLGTGQLSLMSGEAAPSTIVVVGPR